MADLMSLASESLRNLAFCAGRGFGSLSVLPSLNTVTHFGGVTDAILRTVCEWRENFQEYMRERGPLSSAGRL